MREKQKSTCVEALNLADEKRNDSMTNDSCQAEVKDEILRGSRPSG